MRKCCFLLFYVCILTGCQTLNKYSDAKSQTDLSRFEGKNILIKGRVSNVPWQHLIGNFKDYPVAVYFDIGKDFDKYQTVIYLRKGSEPDENEIILVKGQVVKVEGMSKRGNSDKDIFNEFHILVHEYEYAD